MLSTYALVKPERDMQTHLSEAKPSRKGDMTRERILDYAADLASMHGLGDVTIGRLAAELGMSKSGLFAHFGSKLDLQLATIAAARRRYNRTAVEPGLDAPKGLAQLEKTMDYLLAYLKKRVFPGGCFFNTVNAEFHARPGPIRDDIRAGKAGWRVRVERMIKDAQRNGEIRRDIDPKLLAYELECFINGANWTLDERRTLQLTRRAIRDCIDRVKCRS